MATQYTAGLTTGQVLTAATMNQIGAVWETWTPEVKQTGVVTATINSATYGRIQKLAFGQCRLSITGAGTGGSDVTLSLPISAVAATSLVTAWGFIYDASINAMYNVTGYLNSASTLAFVYQSGFNWGTSPNTALANGDQMRFAFMYEVA